MGPRQSTLDAMCSHHAVSRRTACPPSFDTHVGPGLHFVPEWIVQHHGECFRVRTLEPLRTGLVRQHFGKRNPRSHMFTLRGRLLLHAPESKRLSSRWSVPGRDHSLPCRLPHRSRRVQRVRCWELLCWRRCSVGCLRIRHMGPRPKPRDALRRLDPMHAGRARPRHRFEHVRPRVRKLRERNLQCNGQRLFVCSLDRVRKRIVRRQRRVCDRGSYVRGVSERDVHEHTKPTCMHSARHVRRRIR